MRNAANKMMNPIDPCTENHFWSFIEISEQNGSLCGFHSGSLWPSFVQKALARLATSQLHSRSLSHSGTDMWISAFKIFSLPVPSRPATRSFCHYPTRSRPEVKNHYPSVSAHFQVLFSCLVGIIARPAWLLLTRSVVPDCFKYNLTSGRLRGDWIKLLGYLRQIFSQFLPVSQPCHSQSWSLVLVLCF